MGNQIIVTSYMDSTKPSPHPGREVGSIPGGTTAYKAAGNRAFGRGGGGGGGGEENFQIFRRSGSRGTPLEILTHKVS